MKNKDDKSVGTAKVQPEQKLNKTNEKYGLYFSSSIKISDPNTGKVILQKRCN